MLSPTTIWIAFALYMCFLLGVAVYVTVQDKKKAAGGSLLTASVKWPVLVMTYIASLMSTWVFFAGPGAYYRGGLGSSANTAATSGSLNAARSVNEIGIYTLPTLERN